MRRLLCSAALAVLLAVVPAAAQSWWAPKKMDGTQVGLQQVVFSSAPSPVHGAGYINSTDSKLYISATGASWTAVAAVGSYHLNGDTLFVDQDNDMFGHSPNDDEWQIEGGHTIVAGAEGGNGRLGIHADQGDDTADQWDFTSSAGSGNLTLINQAATSGFTFSGPGMTIGSGSHYPDSETVEGVSPELNVVGTAANDSWVFLGRFSNDGAGPAVVLGKTRDTSIGAVSTMAQSGDDMGSVYFVTPDQSTWQTGVRIFAEATANHVNATSGGARLIIQTDNEGNDVGNVAEVFRVEESSDGGIYNKQDSGGYHTGASDDLEIKHDGTDSRINNATGNLVVTGSGSSSIIRLSPQSGEQSIDATANGSVALFDNDSKKFETSSSGVTVTGELAGGTIDLSSGATDAITIGPADEGEVGATALGLFLGASNTDEGVYFLVGGAQEGIINTSHVSMGDDAGDSLVVGATSPGNRQFTVNNGASWTGFNAGDASLSNSSSPSMKENITAIQAAAEAAVAAALLDSSASYLFNFKSSALRNPADLAKAAKDTLTVPDRVAEIVARLQRERAYIDTVDSTVTPERRDTSYVGLVDTVATVDTVALVENVRRVVASVDTVVLPSPVGMDIHLMRVDTTWANVGDTTWTLKRGRQVVPRGVAVPDTTRDTLEVVGGGSRVLTKIGSRFIPEHATVVEVTPRKVQYATERFLGVVASSERDAITDSVRTVVMANYNRRVKSINDRARDTAARKRVGPMADEFAAVARAMGMPASDTEVNGDVYREALRIALRVQQREINDLKARVAALEGR